MAPAALLPCAYQLLQGATNAATVPPEKEQVMYEIKLRFKTREWDTYADNAEDAENEVRSILDDYMASISEQLNELLNFKLRNPDTNEVGEECHGDLSLSLRRH